MARDDQSSREEFTAEAEELLDTLSGDVAELETQDANHRPELINKIFRGVHTLKGLAGMFGMASVGELAHKLEDMLDRLRMGRLEVVPDLINLLYDALDVLARLVRTRKDPAASLLADAGALLRRVEQIVKAPAAAKATAVLDAIDLDEQTRNALTEYEEHRLIENVRNGRRIFAVQVRFEFTDFDEKLRALSKTLGDSGEVISTLPSVDPQGTGIGFRLLYGTNVDQPAVAGLAPEAAVTPLGGAPRPATASDSESSLRSASSTVRVDTAKLDHLMNVVGELLIARTQLEALARNAPQHAELTRIARSFSRKLDELQSSVIDTRLIPVGQIYAKLGRTVRQIARELGKEVELVLRGEDTELDKTIVEELSDPLLHLIRNAIDHGIETPDERLAAGKPRAGTLTMKAFQHGNSVVLEISDDGRGIDPQRVRETAIARGLIAKGESVDAHRAHELLFAPGFSTAAEVSELSGRGVGLDVVKRNLEELKGSIEIVSKPGAGTTFRVMLPITLAIIQALIVRAGGDPFAIPLSAVDETLRLHTDQLQSDGRRELFALRDASIPVVRLDEVFALRAATPARQGKRFMVVARSGDKIAGLLVDELLRQQDIVIKSLGERLKKTAGVAGVAEVGEGELILVVDAAALIQRFGQRTRSVEAEPLHG